MIVNELLASFANKRANNEPLPQVVLLEKHEWDELMHTAVDMLLPVWLDTKGPSMILNGVEIRCAVSQGI